MNIDFKLPELGENVASGDVVSVLVREGDVIAANDGVVELETDKAVVEIPCPYAGEVTKVHVAKGQTLKVGQPVLSVEMEAEIPAKLQAAPAKPRPAVTPAKPAKSPHPSPLPEGEGTEEASPLPKGEGTEQSKPDAARPAPKPEGSPANWAWTFHRSKAAAKQGGSPLRTSAPRPPSRRPLKGSRRNRRRELPPSAEPASRPCRPAN